MAKSIEPVIKAFYEGKSKKVSNTYTDGKRLYLFGNCIAEKRSDGIYMSNGGYFPTRTTQDRLNMLGAEIAKKKSKFYIKGIEWDGNWIKLGELLKVKEIKKQKLWD